MISTLLGPWAAEISALGFLVFAIAVGYIYARQGAAKAWKEVAEARQAKIEEQEGIIAEMRERVSRLEAQVEHLRSHDLTAVLEWGYAHEVGAETRAAELKDGISQVTEVLAEIRDRLPDGPMPSAAG